MRKLKENFERKPHYGIRKLTIGVASVVIGLSFLGYTSNVVKADSENTAETNQTAKDPESEAETASSDNDTQENAKKASEISPVEKKEETSKPTDSVARDKDKTTAPEKTKNTLPVVTGTDNQNQITSAQELSESKDATSDNQKSELGKSPVNVDDWKYNTDTNQDINLTDYIGNDKVNIVIPNDQDFIKAGKLNEGHAVKISSKTMHNLIVKDKPTSVIISKTNNGKVVAADSNWSNAFGGSEESKDLVITGIASINPNLKALDLTNLDTHNITNFRKMFYYGDKLTTVGDLSNWDVSNGESFAMMFRNASALTDIGDLSNWNVSKSTDFTGMFNQARHIKSLGDLSNWNVSNSESFANMFRDTWNLHDIGDVSSWDVSNSKSTEWMFGNSALDKINISGWNLSNTTDFNNMFQGEPFKEVYNKSTKLWVPQPIHKDKIVIANDIKLPANANKIVKPTDFAGGSSHQFVITNNQVLLELKEVNINNTITIMQDKSTTLFTFVVPSFYQVNDMEHIEDAIKKRIIAELEYAVDWYDSNDSQEGMLGYTTSQLKAITSPINQDLTISDNKEIGTLTLRKQNSDGTIKDVKVPLIWNMNQLKQDEVQEVIAVLPNGDKKILNRQVIQYHRDINWDKLLIDDRIQFTDWQVVPGTLDHWKALNYYIDDSDNVYYFGDPNTASKDNTIVFNAAIPGYKLELDKNDSIEEEKQVLDDENGPYKGNKPPKKFHDEYIHFYYTARKYKATFKYVNDYDKNKYPRFQYSLDPLAHKPIEETYNELINIPKEYKTLPQFFVKQNLKLSYIEYEGRHYQPEDLTKLKYTATKDTEFIYHLVPDASVITYKDVTGLAEKDYDSKGKIITDSVMKNLNVNPNPENGQWNYDKNGWNYQVANWTFVKSVSPDKVNLTVYLKANDKSINRVIKYVDGDGNEFLPSENTSMTVNHTVGDFVNTDNGLSPKYNGDLSGGNIFQIPSTKEKGNQKYYFDVNSKYFTTGAEKDKTPIADNGITVDKSANTITVKVPENVKFGTTYIFVLPYVQSHINVIYKDVTGLSNDQYASQAKNIEGHNKPIEYTDRPNMSFENPNDWDYKKDGWELASSDEIQFFPGADHKYNQDYVIYLKHGTEPVSKTVTETIEYQLADGTKLPGLTYENAVTLNGTKDKVTGDIIYDDQTLAAVTIPTKKGYTASVDNKPVNKIEKIKVDGNTADIIKTVTYTPNAQHAMVEYVDDTENKVIAQSPILSGVTDGKINYSTDQTIKSLEAEGYELVQNSDETKTDPMIFDNDDNIDQLFRVHFVHGTQNVNRQGKVTETIDYKFEDGKTAQPTVTQTKDFSENGVKDSVTGKITWTPATPQKFDDVVTLKITGYKPNKDNVDGTVVKFGDQDIVEHVVYSPDAQHAHLSFVDDTTGTKLLVKESADGHSDGGPISFTNGSTDLDNYVKKGYKFINITNDTAHVSLAGDSYNNAAKNFGNFDHNDDEDQNFTVHLVHDTVSVHRNHSANFIIHYVYKDGKQAKSDTKQTLNFTEDGLQDLVTNNITWTPAKSQKFTDVETPKITGYKPDQDKVTGPSANFKTGDSEVTVTYTPNAQHAMIEYIDDTENKVIAQSPILSGVTDGAINYSTKQTIKSLEAEGYKLVQKSDETKTNPMIFDNDDNSDQLFRVHFVHNIESVSDNNTVKEIVHYVYENGDEATDDKEQQVSFKRNGKLDHVTGKTVWDKADAQEFVEVDSPEIIGYTPDFAKINGVKVNFDDKNIEHTVIYKANAQTAKITYIDDTDSKTLDSEKTDGHYNEQIAFKTNPNEKIKNFENKGYKLISNNFKDNKYVADNNKNVFEVHFVHNTKQVSRKDDVNMTVHYVMSDDSKAPSDNKQTVSFSENGVQDLVTNKVNWNKADAQEFVEVDSPEIIGYTPSVSKVDRTTVHFGDKDIALTVIYKANNENAVITYVDDATGHNLKQNEASGKFKANIAFDINPQDQIKIYEKQGYKLVSNDFNNNVYHEGKNEFFVHLTHNTELATRTDSVSRTVKYLYENGKQAKPDSVQTIHFIENGITDNVTKNTKWNAAEPQKFNNIASPKLTGYTPDKENVLGETVNFGDKDIEVTVIYKADDQRIIVNYIDQDTGKTLQTKNLTGKTNADAQYSTQSVINSLEKDHYVLVSDDTNGKALKFDNDTNKDQTYNIYLKHDHKSLKDHSEVNETIHYIYSDNSKAAADYKANTIKFDRNGDQDLVTDEITWDAWTKAQSFAGVKSPDIKGYTPNHLEVESKTVDHDSKDINIDVIYHANDQQADIKYVDDTTGEVLGNDSSTGKFDQTITFGKNVNDQIKDYQNDGYLLVSNNFNNQKYQSNNVENQFEVHLKHATKNMKRTNTVKEIIHYVFSNGSKVADDNIQNVNFEENGVQDLVTKAIEWENAQTQSFNAVASPHVAGYTSDNENVTGKTVNFGDKDIEITVTYHANPQTAHFIFRDDDLKTDLEKQDMHGKTDENIDFTNAQNSFADYLLNRGFEFVNLSDETASRNNASDISDQILTTNKEEVKNYQNKFGNPYEQFFVIHLKHGVRDTKPGDKNKDGSDVVLTGEAKAIIHYVDEDGNKVADDSIQTIKFSRTGKTDAVTGQVIELNPWKADKPFASITSPEISGYTANKDEVLPATPMSPEEAAQEYTVVYTKNEQGSEEHHDGGDSGDDDQPDTPVDNPTSGDSDEFGNPSDWEKNTVEKDVYTKNDSKDVRKNKFTEHVEKDSKHAASNRDVIGKAEVETKEKTTNKPIAATVHNLGKKQTQAELPQTGEKQDKAGLIGLAFASIAGLIGLVGKRRKNK